MDLTDCQSAYCAGRNGLLSDAVANKERCETPGTILPLQTGRLRLIADTDTDTDTDTVAVAGTAFVS